MPGRQRGPAGQLLIGAASGPQAAAAGFRAPYTIPDAATAALGTLLAITILATAGRIDRWDTTPKIPCAGQAHIRGSGGCLPSIRRSHSAVPSQAGRAASRKEL